MYQNLPHRQVLQHKLQKVCRQLQQLLFSGKSIVSDQIRLLTKRRDKYAKQLLSYASPLSKAAGAIAITALLSAGAKAQTCNTFANADAANPITIKGIPASREPYFVDIDGDGDLDCYVLDEIYYYDAPFFLKNVGTNKLPAYKYTPAESGFPLGGYALDYASTGVQFVDIDGDGDYDCFLAEAYPIGGQLFGGLHVKYFENQGTPTNPHFVSNEAKNPVGFTYAFYNIGFTFADIDGDGDLDFYYYNDFSSYLYKNTGTKTNPQFTYYKFEGLSAGFSERTYYDWNKDGLLDYFESGTYYKNIGPKNNPKYMADNADGPGFGNGQPRQFTDINGDGSPEVFNKYRGFSTLAPVPVIDTSTVKVGSQAYTKLTVSPVAPNYTYQWYLNKRPIANAKRPSIIAQSDGFYTATITDSCGTGNSLPFKISNNAAIVASTFAGVSSMTALPGSVSVKAYPNPFTNAFVLQLGAAYTRAAIVKIVDVQGRVISSLKPSGNTMTLGGSLQKGVYVIQVWQDGAILFTQKIIKQ